MIVATAGHVDHGKSLLIRMLTGTDPDRLAEEKRRGMTIDLGFAYTSIENESIGFIDVPGHHRFIANMLSGVHTINLALLVIATDDGPRPQTREHLEILRVMETTNFVAVFTKIDLCDEYQIKHALKQSEELFDELNWHPLRQFLLSPVTGEGMDSLSSFLAQYSRSAEKQRDELPFRLCIDRSFVVKGSGSVVTGSVMSGNLNTGDELTLLPANTVIRARQLHVQNKISNSASKGDRCAINLAGHQIDVNKIHRGNWLTSSGYRQPVQRIFSSLCMLPDKRLILRHGTRLHFHSAANHCIAHVYPLDVKQLEPGGKCFAELRLTTPLNLWMNDKFVIRDESCSITIGGGLILDPYPDIEIRNRQLILSRLVSLEKGNFREFIDTYPYGVTHSRIKSLDDTSGKNIDDWADQQHSSLLTSANEEPVFISNKQFNHVCKVILSKTGEWHDLYPYKTGLDAGKLHALTFPQMKQSSFNNLIKRLLNSGQLTKNGNFIALPGINSSLPEECLNIWNLIIPILSANVLNPPVIQSLADLSQTDINLINRYIPVFIESNLVWKPIKNRIFLSEARDLYIERIRELVSINKSGNFTVIQFRDITGIGRNLAIEVLEYFDMQGVTLRKGNERTISNYQEAKQ